MASKQYAHTKDCSINAGSGICSCGAQAASDYHDRAEARRAAMAPPAPEKKKRVRKSKKA